MLLAMGQMKISPIMDENMEKTLQWIEKCRDVDLMFFPEVQWSPFFPQYPKSQSPYNADDYALSLTDKRILSIQEMCRKVHTAVILNLYIRKEDGCYDTSIHIDQNGQLLGTSEMVHIAQLPQFYEQDYYLPSKTGFHVYDFTFGKIGTVICFDRHIPESIRKCAKDGAQLILIPTANTTDEPMDLFAAELRTAAFQNNVFIAMCNRVGREDQMLFSGESIIIDSDGNVLRKADSNEEILIQDVDLNKTFESRKKRPYIHLLRPEVY